MAEMPEAVLNVVEDGDIVITMWAGSISSVSGKLLEKALEKQ